MTRERLSRELETVVSSGMPLRQIVSALREYRRSGVSRREVQLALESLRDQAKDEAIEDRILEVMDIVSGFCPRESTVWEDE
jgi:type II secretory pathway component PulF